METYDQATDTVSSNLGSESITTERTAIESTLRDINNELQAKLDTAIAERDEKATLLLQAQRFLQEYKVVVRAEAIRVQQQQGWCIDGLNTTLRNLELEEYSNDYSVSFTINVSGTVFGWEDGADDLRQAIQSTSIDVSCYDVSIDMDGADVDRYSVDVEQA